MKFQRVLFAMLFIGQLPAVLSIEPTTTYVVGTAGMALGIASYNIAKCHFYECCNNLWIVNNITALNTELDKGLYGQHLAKTVVKSQILAHLGNPRPKKPLVLSFHGPPGTGKTYVSNIIAKALYREGMDSKNVRYISATGTFPRREMVHLYKDKLRGIIERQVSECGQSLFIIDEIDQMPNGLIDTIKPYLDHHKHLNGVDYRRAIFIFLSNDGSEELTEYLTQKLRNGFKREDIRLKEIEHITATAAFSTKSEGGMWRSRFITNHLVSTFVPFLPLNKNHVKQCIQDAIVEADLNKHQENILKELIEKVAKELLSDSTLFSETGCKHVVEKVNTVMSA